jgi:hypothetical protein
MQFRNVPAGTEENNGAAGVSAKLRKRIRRYAPTFLAIHALMTAS